MNSHKWKNYGPSLELDGEEIWHIQGDVVLPEPEEGICFIVDRCEIDKISGCLGEARQRNDIYILNYSMNEISNGIESFVVEPI